MKQYLRTNLFLSSLLALILISCSPATGHKFSKTVTVSKADVQSIINKDNSLLYKAKIDLYNNHFSGLIILKQIEPSISHLTFVTEIGMKMFDFEIRDTSFKLVYVFEPLNNPRVIKLLESDMKLILLQHLYHKQATMFVKKDETIYKVKDGFRYYYVLNTNSKSVKKIIKKGKLFAKVKVTYLYNESSNASRIQLKHKGLIRLKIELNNIPK
jgi:hypothetical protein